MERKEKKSEVLVGVQDSFVAMKKKEI